MAKRPRTEVVTVQWRFVPEYSYTSQPLFGTDPSYSSPANQTQTQIGLVAPDGSPVSAAIVTNSYSMPTAFDPSVYLNTTFVNTPYKVFKGHLDPLPALTPSGQDQYGDAIYEPADFYTYRTITVAPSKTPPTNPPNPGDPSDPTTTKPFFGFSFRGDGTRRGHTLDFVIGHVINPEGATSVVLVDNGTVLTTMDLNSNDDFFAFSVKLPYLGVNKVSAYLTTEDGRVVASENTAYFNLGANFSGAPSLAPESDTGVLGDGVTSATAPTLSGLADNGWTVTLYDGTTVVGTGVADPATGAYAITASPLADGTHKFSVRETDAAGTLSAASLARTVVIDTKPPPTPLAPILASTSDTGRSSSDGITSDATPTLTGRAEAGSTVRLYDGATLLGTATAGSSGAYAVTSSALLDGSHTLTVTATDKAGNASAPSPGRVVTIDTTAPDAPPTPTLDHSSDTGVLPDDGITSDTTPLIDGTAEAGAIVTLYDKAKTKLGSAVADGDGKYAITSAKLADGAHRLTVTATDAAGNVSAASGALAVTIDTKTPAAPTITLDPGSDTGASKTDGITANTTPTLTGKAEARAGVFIYDGEKQIGFTRADDTGIFSTTLLGNLAEGTHRLTAKAEDVAGHVSAASAPKTVLIDTTAPSVAITSPVADGAGKRTVSGTGEAGSSVTLTENGAPVGPAVTVGSKGTWSETITFKTTGAHDLVATAIDKAGNSASSLNAMVQAMSTMTPQFSAAPTASPAATPQDHTLAASHA